MPKNSFATTVAATVATLNFNPPIEDFEVWNRDGGAELWYTLDGSTPSVDSATAYFLPASISKATHLQTVANVAQIKFISTAPVKVMVSA